MLRLSSRPPPESRTGRETGGRKCGNSGPMLVDRLGDC